MMTPFPGMDPYLEHPAIWQDVHNRLNAAIADAVTPLVAPRYYDLRIEYSQPPVPPLSPDDTAWAATLEYPSEPTL